jgi:hypothetical protein
MHAVMHVDLHVSVSYCYEILTRTGMYQQILVKPNTKFNENLILKLLHMDRCGKANTHFLFEKC